MDVRVGDTLLMKKEHPCGAKQWKVLRTGADFRLKCLGCGHEIMVARFKAEKNIRQNILQYGSVVNNAYVLKDTLYITTSDGKVFTAGNVRGSKGDTGDSGVHIGAEAPADPEKNVWIDTSEKAELSDVQKILNKLEYTDKGVQVDLSGYAKDVDLAERDETASGFVRNKTHYEYMDCGETATGTISSIDSSDMLDGTYENIGSVTLKPPIQFNKGQKYKVVFGTEEHIVSWTNSTFEKVDDIASICILDGNEEFTEIHVYAICTEEEKPTWFAKGTQVSIAPIENYEIKQLPERFIPDYISGKEVKRLHKDMYVIAPSNAPDKSRADLVLSSDADIYELQSFLYNLEEPGKVVFLPGTVTLTDTLEIPNGMTVEGYGTTFVVNSGYAGLDIYGDAEIKGVKITTKTTIDTEENQSRLRLVEVCGVGVNITDCRMYTTWGNCIYVWEETMQSWQSSSVKIHGNVLRGNATIIINDKSIVEGNTIIGTKTAHPVTVGGSGCVIVGNDIRSYTETDSSAELKGISVSGNGNVIMGNVTPVIADAGTGNVISGNAVASE